MSRSLTRSLATAAATLLPALACARAVSVGSPETSTTSPASIAASTNVRTIGSVGAPVGLQLWSLRAMAQKDPNAMLRLARSMGITHVETAGLYDLTPEQFADAVRSAGLRVTSMHVGLDDFKKDPQKVIATANGSELR